MNAPVFGLSPHRVIDSYCLITGVTREGLIGPEKTRQITRARHEVMYFMRQLTVCAHASIGAYFGGRDVATVQQAISNICDRIALDPEYREHMRRRQDEIVEAQNVRVEPVSTTAARAVLADHSLSDADARAAALTLLGGKHGA